MLLAALAGCSPAAVPVAPPALAGSADRICQALHAALPDTVRESARRAVEPESVATAAWGDPPIILRCGVRSPPGLEPTSELTSVNDVDWFAEPVADGYVFTTTGRVVNIEVMVPADYAPEVNPLVALAGPIIETVPLDAR